MSRRVLLSCVLLAVAAALPGTAAAEPEPERGLLVVEGAGNSTGELRLAEFVDVVDPVAALTGGGDYAGVLLEPLDVQAQTWPLGTVQVRAFDDETGQAAAILGPPGRLHPGTYRVTLFGQGPVRAAFVLNDQDAGVRAVPRTPLPVRFLGRAEALPAPGRTTARIDLPGALPAGRQALQLTLLQSASADDLRVCATTAGDCTGLGPPLCLPAVPDCGRTSLPDPHLHDGGPRLLVRQHRATPVDRALRWSLDGVRLEPDRLRAAALVW